MAARHQGRGAGGAAAGPWRDGEGGGGGGGATQEPSTQEDLRGFVVEAGESKAGGKKRAGKDENYLHYAPSDIYSEKGCV